MIPNYPAQFWPAAASAMAREVDWMMIAWTVVLVLLVAPIFIFMTWFAFKYRRSRKTDRAHTEARSLPLELSWLLIPFAVSLVFFFWAAAVYDEEAHPPADAMVIQAVGRQWMWKFQHPGGQGEINELHVPMGRSVEIVLHSQDVIHALFVPALRIQFDAIPGRETQLWFTADRPGAYTLYCSELCGTDHALMGGTFYVLSPADYQKWLRQAGSSGETTSLSGKGEQS